MSSTSEEMVSVPRGLLVEIADLFGEEEAYFARAGEEDLEAEWAERARRVRALIPRPSWAPSTSTRAGASRPEREKEL